MKLITNRLITLVSIFILSTDGTVTQVHAATLQQGSAVANVDRAAKRHLIICVDGIGFSLLERMRAEKHFKSFASPGRMIAPFPTLTNISMTEVLRPMGAPHANGYEESYFDLERNRVRGTLLDRFRRKSFIENSFRELFDYHPSALKSGLGYAAPPVSTYLEALTDLIRLRQKFESSKQPIFFAYLGATDSLAHVGGERMVKSYLKRLEGTLAKLQREYGERLTITIFSDHGNDFRSYRRVKIQDALRREKFRLQNSLRDDRSVVLPQFGLVGCAVLFSREENRRRIAETLRAIEGVDFTCFEENGIVHLFGVDAEATIERNGTRYRYLAKRGDPLELQPTLRRLAEERRTNFDGFIEDETWLRATQNHSRPDAVRRVYDGATNHVRNRAAVLVNFKDGYYSGSRTLDIFAFLQATHGNLGREQSLGFVISTAKAMPEYIRAERLWTEIGAPELRRARRINGKRAAENQVLEAVSKPKR